MEKPWSTSQLETDEASLLHRPILELKLSLDTFPTNPTKHNKNRKNDLYK